MCMGVSRCKSRITRECLLTASQDLCMPLTLLHTPGACYAQQVHTVFVPNTVYYLGVPPAALLYTKKPEQAFAVLLWPQATVPC